MAKRAIEQLDAQTAGKVVLEIPNELAERIASALQTLKTKGDFDPVLDDLAAQLKTAT